MPKHLQIANHLSVEELEKRYRAERDGITRSHWQILWLLASGKRTAQVAELTSYSVPWVRSVVKRYHEGGPSAVGDKRHDNPGKPRLLSEAQEAQLRQEVERAERAGPSWNGPQVAQWMSQQTGRKLYPARGWEMLQHLGYSTKTPRPRHVKADVVGQAQFKKT